ncbi:uncharacterized protein LOC142981274 [Anticarsia gemmatalis]|uniref:uncharacterized protein LOC142981274 n=1 Tax=Anticarsia gemmatalis TaxID=129554 RepID=UPI003F75AA55
MLIQVWKYVLLIALMSCSTTIKCDFQECHDDPSFEPDEGPLSDLQFTWLGTLQYIHIKKGTPHYFRVPRVVLITPQFTLCTAADAAQVPEEYALGNVAFGDYERDEAECGLSLNDLNDGASCEPAILIMPIADVLLHPEYKHFGGKDSVAVLKMLRPLKSKYMVPVCLPLQDLLVNKHGLQTRQVMIQVDYTADSPRDFGGEEKEVTKVTLLPKVLCNKYEEANRRLNLSSIYNVRTICSTGCGFRSGAPMIVHEPTGHWTLVALSIGGSTCPDPLRTADPATPPHHLMVFPYLPWISTAITGNRVGAFVNDDPFGYNMMRSHVEELTTKWVGHWWTAGQHCFLRLPPDADYQPFRFYHETFYIKPTLPSQLTYFLEIIAPYDTNIICVKVHLPHSYASPTAWELGTPLVRLRIPLIQFNNPLGFQVEAWGRSVSDESSEPEKEPEGQERPSTTIDPEIDNISSGGSVAE